MQNANDIRVQYRCVLVKCKCADRPGRIAPDSFEGQQSLRIAGQLSSIACHRLTGNTMKSLRPDVVAEGIPCLLHVLDRRIRQIFKARVTFQKLMIFRYDTIHLRLLQHHLRNQDVIGV